MARAYIIPKSAHVALTTSVMFRGPRVTITEQLGPDVWPGVKTTLENLGAVYVIGTSGFEFEAGQDAQALVTDALATGRVWRVSASHGYVATPADLAEHVVSMYGEIGGKADGPLEVLEPSAGTGPLVAAIVRADLSDQARCAEIATWMRVTAVEVDERRARQIPSSPAVKVVRDRFEAWAARTQASGKRFDRIIMNPPFSVPGDAQLWAKHLLLAWNLLAPGGRMVAIVPACITEPGYGPSRAARAAVELLHTHGGYELLSPDEFDHAGVSVITAAVWFDRPLVDAPVPRMVADLPEYVARPYTGDEVPVQVPRLFLTRGASVTMPVQAWRDAWRGGTVRVLRHRGSCIVCERLVWAFDDGENDPRGALGDHAPELLDPAERAGMPEALPVVACFMCMNDSGGETYDRAWSAARRYWGSVVAARQSGWSEPARDHAAERAGLFAELVMAGAAEKSHGAARERARTAPAPVYVSGWTQDALLDLDGQ